MLVLRGRLGLGASELTSSIVFARRVWLNVLDRRGLVLDTRLCPATRRAPRPGTCILLLLEGTLDLHRTGERFHGPSLILMSEEHLEGASGARELTFTTKGEPLRLIELHARAGDARPPAATPVRVSLAESSWVRAAHELASTAKAGASDETLAAALRSLLDVLAEHTIVSEAVAASALGPLPFEGPLQLLRPLAERFVLAATHDELLRFVPVSRRQLDRYLKAFFELFPLVGAGWRATTVHLRVKLAVLFLSAENASPAEVARLVGYSGAIAMSRAFQDAGLPTPTSIKAELERQKVSASAEGDGLQTVLHPGE